MVCLRKPAAGTASPIAASRFFMSSGGADGVPQVVPADGYPPEATELLVAANWPSAPPHAPWRIAICALPWSRRSRPNARRGAADQLDMSRIAAIDSWFWSESNSVRALSQRGDALKQLGALFSSCPRAPGLVGMTGSHRGIAIRDSLPGRRSAWPNCGGPSAGRADRAGSRKPR